MGKKNTTKKFRVFYHQVDQMGIVHHAQYAYYLEQSRIDWLRNFGIHYADLERDGILMPLTEISLQYKRPLHFDDTFFVHTQLTSFEQYFVTFSYRLELEDKTLVATADTRLVFMDATTRRAIKCPLFLLEHFTLL